MRGWKRRNFRGTRHRTKRIPHMYGRSLTPDMAKGNSYFEYNVGDTNAILKDNFIVKAANVGDLVTEREVKMKADCYFQSVTGPGGIGDERIAWNAISLNSPIIRYGTPAGWTGNAPNVQYFPINLRQGWNNISKEANQFKFCTIYNTFIKITALPASTTGAIDGSKYNLDSLALYFCFPNEKEPDATFLNRNTTQDAWQFTLAAQDMADPLKWDNTHRTNADATNTTQMGRESRVRCVPLNTPNTSGGGRTTITARWRLKGPKELNAAPATREQNALCPYNTGVQDWMYYGFPRMLEDAHINDIFTAEIPYWCFYWGIGSTMGHARTEYQYRFKIQMWCDFMLWDKMENIPKYIGGVPTTTGDINYRLKEKEKEDDEMDTDDLPSVPSTPVLNQMFAEFAAMHKVAATSSSSSNDK